MATSPAQPSGRFRPLTRRALPPALRQALANLYDEVDREIAATGVVCWMRGHCCDFDRNDHRLYASTLEIEYVRELHPERFAPGSKLCPFWNDGKCTERERRPLGCRTYFCDPQYAGVVEAIYETYHERIRKLSDAFGLGYLYGPFVDALRNTAPDRSHDSDTAP